MFEIIAGFIGVFGSARIFVLVLHNVTVKVGTRTRIPVTRSDFPGCESEFSFPLLLKHENHSFFGILAVLSVFVSKKFLFDFQNKMQKINRIRIVSYFRVMVVNRRAGLKDIIVRICGWVEVIRMISNKCLSKIIFEYMYSLLSNVLSSIITHRFLRLFEQFGLMNFNYY